MDQSPYHFRKERKYSVQPTHAESSSKATLHAAATSSTSAPSQHVRHVPKNPRMAVEERLSTYLAFFRSVVPEGLVAIHAPSEPSQCRSQYPKREEIRLQTYSGKIFMAGLVGNLSKQDKDGTEQAAAGEAMNKNEFHDVEGLKEWNFFTGHEYLTFFTGELLDGECVEDYTQDLVGQGDGREVAVFDPETEAKAVRAYLKGKWDVVPIEDR